MTKKEALKVIALLKSGEKYKKGHYHYRYVYYWYDSERDLFYYKMEDLSMNIFEPSMTEQAYTEDVFLKKLMNEREIKDFVDGGLSIDLPKSKPDLPEPNGIKNGG